MRKALLLALLALLALSLAGCGAQPAKDKGAFDDAFTDTPEAAAGKGLIRGVVVDPALAPVKAASVDLQGVAASQSTDDNGAFVFPDLDPGTYFLQVSKPGWTTIQQSVEVLADVDEPPIVKVAIEQVPGLRPRAITLDQDGFIACSYGTPINYDSCATIQEENSDIYFDIEGTPDWIQTEIVWESTQPSGDWLYVVQGLCKCADDVPDVGDGRFDEVADAVSPHNARADPAFLDKYDVGTPDRAQLVVSVSASGPEPETTNGSGLALNQAFHVYATFFYNIDEPDADWTFVADGPYPVPQ